MSATPMPSRLAVVAERERAAGRAARANPLATSLVLVAADAAAVLAAWVLGVLLWQLVNPSITMMNQFHAGQSLALYLAAYWIAGLYGAAGPGAVEELRRITLATLLVSLVLTAAVFLTKAGQAYSRGAFIASGVLVLALAPGARAAVRAAFARRAWWGVPVLILGAGRTARLMIAKLAAQPELGLKPVACLDDDPRKQGECGGVPVPGGLELAKELAGSLGVEHVLVAMPGVERGALMRILERYAAPFSRVIVVPNLFGIASLWVTPHDLGGVLGLEVRQNLLAPANRAMKRVTDLVLAGLLGLAALPVLVVAAVWVRLVSAGPVLYTQERAGIGERPLKVRKLRTMYPNSEEVLERFLEGSPAARAEWRRYFKLREDPRVLPRIGKWLRRTSLDELPQIWSVLKGEMSLVGPRPFPDYHLDQFDAEFRALRAKVRPGLTGLWQVSARSDGDLEVQQELDTYYIRNWSLWLELDILARTVGVVLRGRGAY